MPATPLLLRGAQLEQPVLDRPLQVELVEIRSEQPDDGGAKRLAARARDQDLTPDNSRLAARSQER